MSTQPETEHKTLIALTTKRVRFVTARMARMEEFNLTELRSSAEPCIVVVEAYRHIDPETVEVILRRVQS